MNTKTTFVFFCQNLLSEQDSNKSEQGGKFPQNSYKSELACLIET